MASGRLLLASASVLRPILKVMPRCASLRVSASKLAVISRNESKALDARHRALPPDESNKSEAFGVPLASVITAISENF